MAADFFTSALTNLWAVILVVLLFGGSIFVHELGHFLAARRRGVKVERFSIGFGPAIWSRRAKDGVEYRVSWFPLGGYVLLPQLADLGALEGPVESDVSKLPPVGYATKMIVFVAGAFFNILFAFALACVVWVIGQPTEGGSDSTTVGDVLPTIRTADNVDVVSPAAAAGLKPGDVIIAVDGDKVATFGDIREHLALGSGWNKEGQRQTIFTVRRGSQTLDLTLLPVLAGREKLRKVGFGPVEKLQIGIIVPNSPVARAGLVVDDVVLAVNGTPVETRIQLSNALSAAPEAFDLLVLHAGEKRTLHVQRAADAKDRIDIGIYGIKSELVYTHPKPWEQIVEAVTMT